jgi:hypothetical protein
MTDPQSTPASETPASPERHWDALRQAMETDGPDAVVAYVEALAEPVEQRRAYGFAQRAFSGRDWEGKDLDKQVVVARAGIACSLRHAEAEQDPAERDKRTDFANVLSYNLAADLAPCWPGDETPRERRHLEAGLAAAEDCLRWRQELSKGPFPFAIAYWARGVHRLFLGLRDGAVEDMRAALEHGLRYTAAEGKPGGWLEGLNAGYLGLAERAAGEEGGAKRYDEARQALEALVVAAGDDEHAAGDAKFALDQLGVVAAKL